MSIDLRELWDLDRGIYDALEGARVAQERIDKIADALRGRERAERGLCAVAAQARTEANDLRIHLRDRDAHIRNLEAELRPLLLAGASDTPETLTTEALL